MPDHYASEDRRRTLPVRQALKALMLPEGVQVGAWWDMDEAAKALGARVATCQSKFREFNDYHHVADGIRAESEPLGGGRWRYRLTVRQPEQLPLLDGHHAQQ